VPNRDNATERPLLSLILPVLDEAATLPAQLARLQDLRRRGAEVLVVDGGSADATPVLARPLVDRLIAAPRGRAAQMNAGAGAARGQVLLFLHADTTLPPAADALITRRSRRVRRGAASTCVSTPAIPCCASWNG
jgi:glycosyltransferase involved in cell wall biosynthesis